MKDKILIILLIAFIGAAIGIGVLLVNHLKASNIEENVNIEETVNKDEEEENKDEIEENKDETEENVIEQAYTPNTHIAYMKGITATEFNVNGKLTRAEIATILSRLSANFDDKKTYENRFTDVKSTSWNSNYIGFCVQNGIMQGFTGDVFKPNDSLTKAEFLTAIVRFAELPYIGCVSEIVDVKGTWCEGYVGILEKNGIIKAGEDGKLHPSEPILRGEVCRILNATLGRTPDKEMIDKVYKPEFTDVKNTDAYYYDVVEATYLHEEKELHKAVLTIANDNLKNQEQEGIGDASKERDVFSGNASEKNNMQELIRGVNDPAATPKS